MQNIIIIRYDWFRSRKGEIFMSDIRLDFRNINSEWERAHRLMEVLPSVGSVDVINISVNQTDGSGYWLDILEENGFGYTAQGEIDQQQIIARRIH